MCKAQKAPVHFDPRKEVAHNMSIIITSQLQKSLPHIESEISQENLEKIFIAFITERQSETVQLITHLDKNICILEQQKERTELLNAILEEAGGLTVRARNLLSEPNGAEKNTTTLKDVESWFNIARQKFDTTSSDSGFEGVNLMQGDTLETLFDAKGQNKLVTAGVLLTSDELGIRQPDFSTIFTIQNSRIDVMNAIDIVVTVRNTISAHINELNISRDFACQAIECAKSAEENIKNPNKETETAGLARLSGLGAHIIGDDPLADEAQQDILKSFAASPNMEEI